MNHARAAITLYRIATCIEVLSDWCPPVQKLLADQVTKINTLADWHQSQALQAR